MAAENLGSARIVADIWRDTVNEKDKRIAELEAALVALIDAVDAKDEKRIEDAIFVGKGLAF